MSSRSSPLSGVCGSLLGERLRRPSRVGPRRGVCHSVCLDWLFCAAAFGLVPLNLFCWPSLLGVGNCEKEALF